MSCCALAGVLCFLLGLVLVYPAAAYRTRVLGVAGEFEWVYSFGLAIGAALVLFGPPVSYLLFRRMAKLDSLTSLIGAAIPPAGVFAHAANNADFTDRALGQAIEGPVVLWLVPVALLLGCAVLVSAEESIGGVDGY